MYFGNFFLPPTLFKMMFFQLIISQLKQFSLKFILRVIVWDSDTNFVHTFSLCRYAFLMKKSTASCFESSINTQYDHN